MLGLPSNAASNFFSPLNDNLFGASGLSALDIAFLHGGIQENLGWDNFGLKLQVMGKLQMQVLSFAY